MRAYKHLLITYSLAFAAIILTLSGCGREQVGPMGPPGPAGLPGANGSDGAPGANGADGAAGADGQDGQDGLNGADGKDGADGLNGTNGTNGVDGINGTNGTNGTSPVVTSINLAANECKAFAGYYVKQANGDTVRFYSDASCAATFFTGKFFVVLDSTHIISIDTNNTTWKLLLVTF